MNYQGFLLIDITSHYFRSDATSVNQHKEGTLRKVSSETEQLRQQVAKLNRLNDNALAENRFVVSTKIFIYTVKMLICIYLYFKTSRLVNELSEAESSHNDTLLRLRACEKEVDRLKNQLQQYVQEVQKAEDLLYRKVRMVFYVISVLFH